MSLPAAVPAAIPHPAAHSRPPHQHAPSAPRLEADISASGVTWDERRHEWVTDEEANGETSSQQTAATGETRIAADRASADEKAADGKGTVDPEAQAEVIWLEWEENDPQNPFNWGPRKKWITTWFTCLFTLVAGWTGASLAIGNESMIRDLGCSTELAALGLAAFPLGFGLAPLVLAPFSEAFGRYPMYVGSSIFFLVFFIPTAMAKNITTVIVSRLMGGLAASTGSTLVGGTIADLFTAADRGLPMSLFSVCAFAGTGLGPALMGYVEVNLGWRWIQWIQMMIMGALAFCLIVFTRETRGSVILSRRAARLRKTTDPRIQCRSDAERASLGVLIRVSMSRPIYLLCTEAIVAAFSLWIGFCWGVLYLTLEAVPLVYTNVYGFNSGETGLVFFAVVIAAGLGFVTNLYQERLYQRNVATRGPEARLYASCVGGILFPAGIFIFAFAQGRGHWIGPAIGLVLCFTGIFTIYLATFNYLADSYTLYASSALSGQSLCRNFAGFVFPLFTNAMYSRLGYQWASFLAGCIGVVLCGTPFILLAYGPRIRAASKFAKELERMQAGK